mmetsp:Transcript_31339/g.79842  ORF Transcript_31339/g.79842 Transcript_31339/m.79842 type:complete len:96 (+) Transcript_31339:463-750(+)
MRPGTRKGLCQSVDVVALGLVVEVVSSSKVSSGSTTAGEGISSTATAWYVFASPLTVIACDSVEVNSPGVEVAMAFATVEPSRRLSEAVDGILIS